MSFGYTVAGKRDEVLAQLEHAQTGSGLGEEIKELLTRHLKDAAAHAHQHDLHYLINASGHGGKGDVLSFAVKVEAAYIPHVPAAEPEAQSDPALD